MTAKFQKILKTLFKVKREILKEYILLKGLPTISYIMGIKTIQGSA